MKLPLLLLLSGVTSALATDFTLVSFNTRNGGRLMSGKYDHAFQQNMLVGLKPDIVVMQEVDQATRRNGKVDMAGTYAKALGMTPYFGQAMAYDGGGYGGAVLSKFPVAADESIPLPVPGGEPRVCVMRFVRIPQAGTVVVAGVHLDSADQDGARMENARVILARLKTLKEPVIVAGDFNDSPESAVLKQFVAAGFRRVVPKGNPASFPANKPEISIDHVLLRDGEVLTLGDAGMEVVSQAEASDHRPLLARLKAVPKVAAGK